MSGLRPEDEIDAEIEFHLREVTEALVAQGSDPVSARQEAERRYGDRHRHAVTMQLLRASPPARRRPLGSVLEIVAQELRYAVRSLRRAPAFTLTAVTTLALVTGANLTMFGMIAVGIVASALPALRAANVDPQAALRG